MTFSSDRKSFICENKFMAEKATELNKTFQSFEMFVQAQKFEVTKKISIGAMHI